MKKLNKLQEHSGDAMISKAKLVHRKSTLPKRLKLPKRTRQVLEPKDSVNEKAPLENTTGRMEEN